jgi:hypothetical protein
LHALRWNVVGGDVAELADHAEKEAGSVPPRNSEEAEQEGEQAASRSVMESGHADASSQPKEQEVPNEQEIEQWAEQLQKKSRCAGKLGCPVW